MAFFRQYCVSANILFKEGLMLDYQRVDIGWVTGPVLVVALSLSYQAHAATISFTDQAAFLTQVQAPSFEGFESHVVGVATNSVSAAGFTMSSASIQIRNTPLLDAFATEGQQFARWDSTNNGNLVFVFEDPISAFGVTMTDPVDNPAAPLSLTTSVGDSFPSFLANLPNGQVRFFGIINEDAAFDAGTIISNFPDGIGFDEVYFVVVPEPTTCTLALAALCLAVGRRWAF